MNKVILVGRIVKDPEVKTTQNQVSVCSFTLAVCFWYIYLISYEDHCCPQLVTIAPEIY